MDSYTCKPSAQGSFQTFRFINYCRSIVHVFKFLMEFRPNKTLQTWGCIERWSGSECSQSVSFINYSKCDVSKFPIFIMLAFRSASLCVAQWPFVSECLFVPFRSRARGGSGITGIVSDKLVRSGCRVPGPLHRQDYYSCFCLEEVKEITNICQDRRQQASDPWNYKIKEIALRSVWLTGWCIVSQPVCRGSHSLVCHNVSLSLSQ